MNNKPDNVVSINSLKREKTLDERIEDYKKIKDKADYNSDKVTPLKPK